MAKNCKKDSALWVKYRAYLDTVWRPDMADYCYKKCAELVELFNGMIVEIEKQGIETRFCFGYSDWYGPTDDEAYEMARHAAKSEEYFVQENMREFNRVLENLNKHGRECFVVLFCNHPPVVGMGFKRISDVLEAVGGSAYLEDLKGRTIDVGRDGKWYICTDKDVEALKAGYERAAAAHEKKCRAYLKRYGMSKVRTWTYWRDE